jgi:hypothetical protein
MRNVRNAIATATILITGAALAGAPATAEPVGVGSAGAQTTVVAVDLGTDGELLAVRLLADEAGTTIDDAKGGPSAYGTMTGVNVTSGVVPALSITPKPAEARQPGGEKKVTRGAVSLSQPYEDVTIDSAILSGNLGLVDLASEAATAAATSSVSAVLTDATLAGGLASVDGATSSVEAESATNGSQGSRSVAVDEVVVLDLGALLDGLGLDVLDLPVATLMGLLEDLGIVVPGVGDADAVNAVVDDLQARINELTDETSLPTGTTVGDVIDIVNGIGLGELVAPETEAVIEAADPAEQVDSLVDQLQGALNALLGEGVEAVDNAPLLVAKGAEATVTTKAVGTTEGSVAEVTAGIGSIEVGGLVFEGRDLIDGALAVTDTVTNVNNALMKALGGIDPGLADLVQVSLFDRATERGVSSADGTVRAADGVTVLTATVTPPSTLDTIVGLLRDQTGVGEAIEANGGAPPAVSDAMGALEAALGGVHAVSASGGGGGGGSVQAASHETVQAAAGGLTVRVAELLGTSEFRPSTAPTNGPADEDGDSDGDPADSSTNQDAGTELPRTGSTTLPLLALGTLLVALGLGFREWTRMPVPTLARVPSRTPRMR